MADPVDRAQELETWQRESALASRRHGELQVSATHCLDCGELIPEARRAAINTRLCVSCAAEREEKAR